MNSSIANDPRYSALYEKNPEFRELSDLHMDLKKETARLNKTKFLSPEEEARLHEIKKRKLEIKDRMQTIIDAGNF